MKIIDSLRACPDPRIGVPKDLVFLNNIANKFAFKTMRSRDNCILVSTMLNHLLIELGYRSRVVRVTASVCSLSKKQYGYILGHEGDGTFREAAGPGMWRGHASVLVEEQWLLDPTLDQIPKMKPMVLKLESLEPWPCTQFLIDDDIRIYYYMVRNQVGFKYAGDARRRIFK